MQHIHQQRSCACLPFDIEVLLLEKDCATASSLIVQIKNLHTERDIFAKKGTTVENVNSRE